MRTRIILSCACLSLTSCLATLEPFVIKHTGTDIHGLTVLSISIGKKAAELRDEYRAVKIQPTSSK